MDPQTIPTRPILYFEDFHPGQTVTSQGRTVTEADIIAFAGLSGDWSAIHSNAVYAAQHPAGQRVAHGLLGLSIASGLAVRLGFLEESLITFREIDQWKFSLPIFIGDTLHMKMLITQTRPTPRLNGGMVTFTVELINQDGRIVQHGAWSVLVKTRPA